MKTILSIQTAHKETSIALALVEHEQISIINSKIFNEFEIAEKLGEYTKALCDENSIVIQEIDTVLVCIGPGSYTGIRVGLSYAKAFVSLRPIDLIGINYLDCLEYIYSQKNALNKQEVRGIMSARNNNVYISSGSEVIITQANQLKDDKLYIGSGVEYLEQLPNMYKHFVKGIYVTADDMVKYYLGNLDRLKIYSYSNFVEFSKLLPIYVQEPRIG